MSQRNESFFVLAACAVACWWVGQGCVLVPPPPPTPIDAGIDGGAGDCAAAAARLERLACAPASVCSSTGDCDGFAERCEALERDIPGYVNTPCLASAADCAAAEACAQ